MQCPAGIHTHTNKCYDCNDCTGVERFPSPAADIIHCPFHTEGTGWPRAETGLTGTGGSRGLAPTGRSPAPGRTPAQHGGDPAIRRGFHHPALCTREDRHIFNIDLHRRELEVPTSSTFREGHLLNIALHRRAGRLYILYLQGGALIKHRPSPTRAGRLYNLYLQGGALIKHRPSPESWKTLHPLPPGRGTY